MVVLPICVYINANTNVCRKIKAPENFISCELKVYYGK